MAPSENPRGRGGWARADLCFAAALAGAAYIPLAVHLAFQSYVDYILLTVPWLLFTGLGIGMALTVSGNPGVPKGERFWARISLAILALEFLAMTLLLITTWSLSHMTII